MTDVLLDSTFLLPSLGVEVKEISSKDFVRLREISERADLHCSYVSFVEILGKLTRLSEPIDVPAVDRGIKSLMESGIYRWVNPSAKAVRLALNLRIQGHRDNIDNILYSTAFESKMFFLSIDEELKEFLRKNGFDTEIVVNVRELEAKVR